MILYLSVEYFFASIDANGWLSGLPDLNDTQEKTGVGMTMEVINDYEVT